MARVFLIAGLGADKRLYKNIELPGHEIFYADWLEPDAEDMLTTYAQKLMNTYNIHPNDVVIGDSLGGMLATEIAKKITLSKVILISSIKTSDEAPWYFPIFRILPLYKLIPGKWMIGSGFLIRYVFGDMPEPDMELFKSMIRNSSPTFMKWALGAAVA